MVSITLLVDPVKETEKLLLIGQDRDPSGIVDAGAVAGPDQRVAYLLREPGSPGVYTGYGN